MESARVSRKGIKKGTAIVASAHTALYAAAGLFPLSLRSGADPKGQEEEEEEEEEERSFIKGLGSSVFIFLIAGGL